MKRTLAVVSSLAVVLGLGAAAGCGGAKVQYSARAGRADAHTGGGFSGFAREDTSPAPRKFRGAAVGNFNKGYVDGVGAAAFFNKGRPLTDEQVSRLIEAGRRQGDPTGLLALEGYPEGYRTGATHAQNPYARQMTPEQVAQVRKAQGLPPEPAKSDDAHASARQSERKRQKESRKEERKSRRGAKEDAEASAR